ncbi:MAG: MgtC/SapB family protein [Flavisolibacter sp.]|jgi:putative Mg2+ transporter-C (MgtC) family protein|nr:MgtC/SapB family protein [Flavisolibacter sp.]
MDDLPVLLFRLCLAGFVGGIIGAEREYRSKFAGFRTMILICLGSFLFTTLSFSITNGTSDRIASNIVTGIGFLGAGVIFKSENRINGITTAATIWIVAALGMGIAYGAYFLVLAASIIILIALLVLSKLENFIDKVNQTRTYRIVSEYKEDLLKEYEELMRDSKLHFKRITRSKNKDDIIGTWVVNGRQKAHNEFTKAILHHGSVKEFEF